MKIKLHPIFLLIAALYVIFGKCKLIICSVLAVLLHEAGHLFMAKYFGYRLNKICLMPYGAVVKGAENLDNKADFYVSCFGPITSLLVAIITIAIWWIFPNTYDFTYDFVKINVGIAVVNLIPISPLDGARIVLSLSKNRLKTTKILKFAGRIFSVALIVTFFVSLFYEPNFTLLTFGIFLFIGATESETKEWENYVFLLAFGQKEYDFGVSEKVIRVALSVSLKRLLNLTDSKSLVTFLVVDEKGEVKRTITESDLTHLVQEYPLKTKIFEIY